MARPPFHARTPVRFALTALLLFAIWCVLSGKFDALHLGFGAAGSLLIAAAFFPWQSSRYFPAVNFAVFVPWHLGQVLASNLRVARLALSPGCPIAPQLIVRPPEVEGDRAMTTLGSAITLTPGTLTIRMEQGEMIVHALDPDSTADIAARTMERRVAAVFGQEVRS